MARAAEKQSLAQMAKAKGIKYFLISYSDLGGVSRSKLVPAAAIYTIATDGAGFAGFSTYLDMTPAPPGHVRHGRHGRHDPAAL